MNLPFADVKTKVWFCTLNPNPPTEEKQAILLNTTSILFFPCAFMYVFNHKLPVLHLPMCSVLWYHQDLEDEDQKCYVGCLSQLY